MAVQHPNTPSRTSVVIDVAGQRLRLSGQSDPEHVASLAALVNERFDELQRAGRSAAPSQVLAMLALNLADEVLTARAAAATAAAAHREALAAAESRGRELEAAARKAIGDALSTIDRALLADDAQLAAAVRQP